MKNGMATKKMSIEQAAHEYRLEQARKLLEAAGYVKLPNTDEYVKLAELSRKRLKAIRRAMKARFLIVRDVKENGHPIRMYLSKGDETVRYRWCQTCQRELARSASWKRKPLRRTLSES